jgi:hypothetical protein
MAVVTEAARLVGVGKGARVVALVETAAALRVETEARAAPVAAAAGGTAVMAEAVAAEVSLEDVYRVARGRAQCPRLPRRLAHR